MKTHEFDDGNDYPGGAEAALKRAHTPTPYEGTTSKANHCGFQGFAITHCFPGPINIQCRIVAVCEKEEDRAFIVRACNSHAALTTALEESGRMMAMLEGLLADGPRYAKARFVHEQLLRNAATIAQAKE